MQPKKNPRYIKMAIDETMWLYEDTSSQLEALLFDPGAWMRKEVKRCKPSITGNYCIEFSTNAKVSETCLFYGISGTSMVVVSGFEAATVPFLRALRLGKTSAGAVSSPTAVLDWSKLDAALLKVNARAKIEIFVIEDEQKVFAHCEMGSNKQLIASYLSAIALDEAGFRKWLVTTPTMGIKLPRTAYSIDLLGRKTKIDMDSFKVVQRTNANGHPQAVRLLYETLAPGGCPTNCPVESACSSGQGSITSGTIAQRNLECQLDVVIAKPYCVKDAQGTPCS